MKFLCLNDRWRIWRIIFGLVSENTFLNIFTEDFMGKRKLQTSRRMSKVKENLLKAGTFPKKGSEQKNLNPPTEIDREESLEKREEKDVIHLSDISTYVEERFEGAATVVEENQIQMFREENSNKEEDIKINSEDENKKNVLVYIENHHHEADVENTDHMELTPLVTTSLNEEIGNEENNDQSLPLTLNSGKNSENINTLGDDDTETNYVELNFRDISKLQSTKEERSQDMINSFTDVKNYFEEICNVSTGTETKELEKYRSEDQIQFERMERSDSYYESNIKLYRNSKLQETELVEELFSDDNIDMILGNLENLSQDRGDQASDKADQMVLYESEIGFTYEKKQLISKLQKQKIANLMYKQLLFDSNETLQTSVITTQPCLTRNKSIRLSKPLMQPKIELEDQVDSKICTDNRKPLEKKVEVDFPVVLSPVYQSNYLLDCFCYVLTSCI